MIEQSSHTLENRLAELESENSRLKQLLYENKCKLQEYEEKSRLSIEKRTAELNIMNTHLQAAKQELEQYKLHLEEVIRERTVELKNSEMRLLSLGDSITGGAIFEITLTKDDVPWIGYMSKTVSALLEFDVNLIQDDLSMLFQRVHPDDVGLFATAFAKSKQTKTEFNVEIRYLSPNNNLKWLHFRANAVEQNITSTVWVGIITDTTDKNLYQQQIQEREAILDAIIENIPYDFFALDANYHCFLQNSASQKIWGNIVGKTPHEMPLVASEKQLLQNQFQRVFRGEIVNEEIKLHSANGVLYDFQTLLAPILIKNKLQGVLCFNIDITDRKHVEKALIQNEERFRNIFDSSTDAIIIHTREGKIILMNQEFLKIMHITKEYKHINITTFFSKSSLSEFWENFDFHAQNEENVFFETELKTSDKTKIPVEIKSKRIEYLGGEAILSLIRDTTYRRKFERELVNAIIETEEKERARFAADLHDDIGPILSTMKMLTGLLTNTTDVNKINNVSKQILDLVSEAIRSVRETSNSISPHVLKNYGIIAATRNIIQGFQNLLEISIETNCESQRFDSTIEIIYYRVMRELLNNTIKHAQATKIDIQLVYSGQVLKLKYCDNGHGFNVEEKMNSATSRMGLYNIVSRIKSLEAKYLLNSEPNKGFNFYLETKIPN